MCKKWGYYVRSVCALFCIFCMLFLNTLLVNAAGNFFDLLESNNIISDAGNLSVSVPFTVYPNYSYDDFTINSGTYSGTGSGSLTGKMISNETWATTGGNQISVSGTYSESITGRGTWSGTSASYSGKLYGNSTGNISVGTNSENQVSTSSTDTGTISISSTTTHGGSTILHFDIPIIDSFFALNSGVSFNPSDYYGISFAISSSSVSVTSGTVSHVILRDNDNFIYSTVGNSRLHRNGKFIVGSNLMSNDDGYIGLPLNIEFDLLISSINTVSNESISFTIQPSIRRVKTAYQNQVGSNLVTDVSGNKLLEQQVQQENTAQSTRNGILNKITDFFGSFFNNLIGVFVPEDGYFTTWFNNLNQLLTDKLGILYYPFSVIINFFNRCITAFSSQGSGTDIVFPAIEFTNASTGETYTFLQAQHINLADYNVTTNASANSTLVGSSGFGSLVDIIRTFNAFVILFCLLSLLRTKLNLILRGDNNDN